MGKALSGPHRAAQPHSALFTSEPACGKCWKTQASRPARKGETLQIDAPASPEHSARPCPQVFGNPLNVFTSGVYCKDMSRLVNFRAPDSVHAAAKARAEREGSTMTRILLAALSAYADGEPVQIAPEPAQSPVRQPEAVTELPVSAFTGSPGSTRS